MFCPKCGDEYREGFNVCATCNVALVKERPYQAESEFLKPVTVYETANVATIAFVKSIMESEGIEYYCKGEGAQQSLPVQIQVDEKDAEKAREILNQMESSNFELIESDVKNGYTKKIENKVTGKHTSKGLIKGIIMGIFISVVVFFVYDYQQKHLSGPVEYDLNKDSKPDYFCYYKNGYVVREEQDRNFDRKIDLWYFLKDGSLDRGESDDDFDGTVDTWYYFKNGQFTRIDADTNSDNKPEIISHFTNGIRDEVVWYHETSRVLWKKVLLVNGIRQEEYVDQDYDGAFDMKIVYNSAERPISIIQLPKSGVPKTQGERGKER